MSDNRTIIETLQRLTGIHRSDPVLYVNATIDSVDVSARTCSCTVVEGTTEIELPTVYLMAVIDDGVLIIPTVGSTVRIIMSQNLDPFICQYSQIDTAILQSAVKIQLNDGSYNGLVKVADLVTKINAIENLLNDLILKYNTHIHPATAGTTSPTATLETSNITPITQQADLENTTVTHGTI